MYPVPVIDEDPNIEDWPSWMLFCSIELDPKRVPEPTISAAPVNDAELPPNIVEALLIAAIVLTQL
jgi:hypothetical protein